MRSSTSLGQFRHAGCDKHAKLMPIEQEIGQNHQKHHHFPQIPMLLMLPDVVTAWSSRRLSLKIDLLTTKVTFGSLLIDIQSSFA